MIQIEQQEDAADLRRAQIGDETVDEDRDEADAHDQDRGEARGRRRRGSGRIDVVDAGAED